MKFACPTCSIILECPDDLIGTKIHCVRCNQKILVPTPPPQVKPVNKTTLGMLVDEAAPANKTVLGKDVENVPMVIPLATFAPPEPPPAPPPLPADQPDEPRRQSRKARRSSADDFDDDDEARYRMRCPFCGRKGEPYVEEQISPAGWIVFAVLLVFFFPLFWIGLLMKEQARFCQRCNSRLDRGGLRF